MVNKTITLSLADSQSINIGASGLDEICQNIQIILSTQQGTLYLDRLFGLKSDFVDAPMNEAAMKIQNEIYDAIEKYEPRVKIISVTFSGNDDGRLNPVISFELVEGVLL
ncbi:GPW/gp25 family protein [Orbus mooreae]|uniref:GPW/gp25 family protein n=1 Tax=Orbus mooreae TaxID=3074107 RepID=UPI00370D0321